ncbi:MAG: exodeoxyribonuclease VII small subunit [Bacillota bacterium]
MSTEDSISFEESLERLETIVREIESGNLDLDKAMARFSEGMGLVKRCRTLLSEAEQKLYLLLEDNNSGPTQAETPQKREAKNEL